MSQSGPAVAMNVRRSTPGPGGGKGEGGAGESPDTNTTCGGQQDRMGREDGTKQSHSGSFVWAHTVSKTIKKTGGTTWGQGGTGGTGGRGPTSDVLLHVGAGRRGRT